MIKIFKVNLDNSIKIIDNALNEYMDINIEYIDKLIESMKYSLFTGGKRLRPVFGLEVYKLYSDNIDEYLPFAMGVEMIHTYSLIHDDLPAMDDDEYRRGKKTNHIVYGEDMAILSGDGLLNLAFECMLNGVNTDYDNKDYYINHIKATKEVAKYAGINGMIGGQVIDINGKDENMNKDKLIKMYKCKTAGLFQAAIVSAGIKAGASDSDINSLRDFSYNLGLAYQIQDDILDAKEDKEINKLTYLSYYDKEKALDDMNEFTDNAIKSLDKLENKDVDFLKELTLRLVNRTI